MRSSRNTSLIAMLLAVLATVAAGCSTADDAVVATDLGLTRVVVASTAPQGGGTAADDLALRAPGEGSDPGSGPSRSGAQAPLGDVTARPSPPTLSTDAATADTEDPDETVATTSSTVATSTIATSSTTVPEAQVTTSSTAASPSSDPATQATTSSSAPTSSAQATTTVVAPGDLASGEARSLDLLNQLRAGLGLSALSRTGEMDAFARDWSRQMAESGRFEHSTGPYGENIAFTSNTGLSAAEAADLFHQLWVDSPGHYGNMTNGGYVSAGVGLYRTERGWYGTHVFAF